VDFDDLWCRILSVWEKTKETPIIECEKEKSRKKIEKKGKSRKQETKKSG